MQRKSKTVTTKDGYIIKSTLWRYKKDVFTLLKKIV